MFDFKNRIIQMTSDNDLEFDRFKTALDEAIQRHTPIKKRYVRANQVPFINKKIKKSWTGHISEIIFKHKKWHW